MRIIINGDFKQSEILISFFHGFPFYSRERVIAGYLADILGRGSSSRLQNRIRNELGLVYTTSSFSRTFSDTGFLTVSASVDESNLQTTINEISDEIRKLLERGVTQEEMTKVCNTALADVLSSVESLDNYAGFFDMRALFSPRMMTIEERIEEIKDITSDEVMAVARQIFADKPKISVLTKSLTKLDVNFDFGL